MMPRMSGYEVCTRMRETHPANELPVVLLSAKNQVSDLISGLEVGANDYLAKPIAKDELLARINAHMNLRALTNENVRMSAELDVTRKLQTMLLPHPEELRGIEGLDVSAFMEPATEVGGDYYEALNENGQIKFCIGDVTGHGLQSGMLMLMTQMGVRTLVNTGMRDPVDFLKYLNRTLYGNIRRMGVSKGMTLSIMDYRRDDRGGSMTLSGQHESVIIMRADGGFELADTMELGFPLGLVDEISDYVKQTTIHLAPGDGVVLYTDGITEAENADLEQYGEQRLCQTVRRHWGKSADAVRDAVVRDLRDYVGSNDLMDDVTLLVVRQT